MLLGMLEHYVRSPFLAMLLAAQANREGSESPSEHVFYIKYYLQMS